MEKHYIASTDVMAVPHVVAQWEDEKLTEVVVNVLQGQELKLWHVVEGYRVARMLYGQREECKD